jgi:general stress protein 26
MSATSSPATYDAIVKLRDQLKSIRFGMLTSLGSEGDLYSRPMTQQELDDNGSLWFFTSDDQPLAHQLSVNPQANITFTDPASDLYISLAGEASLLKDRGRAQQLWNPAVAVWYPEGVDDPHLTLIRFDISTAEIWDVDSNQMQQLFSGPEQAGAAQSAAKAAAQAGQHQRLNF